MKHDPSNEYRLISKIDKNCSRSINQSFTKTIGDDCAVRTTSGEQHLYSADTLVEGVHFKTELMSFKEIGYKSAIVNLSDIAAMGGTPDSMLVQLVFPKGRRNEESIQEIYEGLGKAVEEYNCPIVGGDLSSGPCWMLAITIVGTCDKPPLLRTSAKSGDSIYVSGFPGLSGAGLELLLNGYEIRIPAFEKPMLRAHVKPNAQIALGQYLIEHNGVHSCMDISDGIAKDALTMAKESNVGMKLFLPNEIRSALESPHLHKETAHYFLHGGEDYELLFTADTSFKPEDAPVPVTKIGEVTDTLGVYFVHKGKEEEITTGGYDHL